MRSFSIQDDQFVTILASLIADELACRFGRYTETMNQAKWSADTRVGRGGIEATAEQQAACAARIASFFGQDPSALDVRPAETIGTWAERVSSAVEQQLTHFCFIPSTQYADAETRHNADDMWRDAAAVAGLLQGRRRVISMVAPHSVLGLVASILAPNLLQIPVVDGRSITPDEMASQLSFGDLIIATPTLWRYLADTLPSVPSNVMGLSFGEPFSVDLAGRLRQRGIGAMRELYGSTETGVLAWRDTPPDPFVLFDHWSTDHESLVRLRSNGQKQKLLAMDDLDWAGGNSFTIGARRDGAVQIGAVNVFPKSISKLISEHPAVADCSVRVSRRSGGLDRLIADICLTSDRIPDQAMAWEIDEWCRQRLRPPERPRIYSFIPKAE